MAAHQRAHLSATGKEVRAGASGLDRTQQRRIPLAANACSEVSARLFCGARKPDVALHIPHQQLIDHLAGAGVLLRQRLIAD
jgi:hypothetical protein